jgi:hypothetical protein
LRRRVSGTFEKGFPTTRANNVGILIPAYQKALHTFFAKKVTAARFQQYVCAIKMIFK